MADEKIQNQEDSLVIKIVGAIIPVAYALVLTYQMIESFFPK